MMRAFLDFLDTLKGEHVYIQTHNFPDPDAISSAFGLQKLLEHFGIESTLCYDGKIDRFNTIKLTRLFGIEMFDVDDLNEIVSGVPKIICVDSQRGGGNIIERFGKQIACIDHHPSVETVEYEYMDIRITGSCASLITDYYCRLNVPMGEDVATALLFGLKMDTLHFQRGVTPLDIEMFGYLLPRVCQEKMDNLEVNTLELADLRAYSAVIESIEVFGKNGFARIPFACPDGMVATVTDFILALEEIDVAIVYSYRDDGIKFSIRSIDGRIHAGMLAYNALNGIGNGGGHAAMAGGFIAKEEQYKLGNEPDIKIKELFLNKMSEMIGEE